MTMEGHPLRIVFKKEGAEFFELDEAALEGVLLSPAIADKRVSVVAVAGAFRKGKTFLLDFLLRYCANQNSESWLSDESCPLQGFKWRQGYKRETVGIYIWSQPFIVERSNGEKIALILMDTQGTFDSESSLEDSSVVFSLSLLVSSTLVYNLSHNIQEDDLMNLQTFTSVGLQASSDTEDSTAFQKLVFLVRDWNFPVQLRYGTEGGKKLLEEMLEIKSCQHPSHRDLRRDLRKCFTDISCYLMPHPGVKVLESVEFDGRLSEIDRKFVEHLGVLVPLLLAPENLVGKKFGGQIIRAKDLFDSFKMFMERFKTPGLVKPTTVTECMARASSQAALGAAKEYYVKSMEAIVRQNQSIGIDKLKNDHENFKRQAVDLYEEKNTFGARTERIFLQCKKQLVKEIDEICDEQYMPRANGQAALEASLEKYSAAIENLIMNKESTVKLQILEDKREEEKQKAIGYFQEENKSGRQNAALFNEYQALLEEKIEELFEAKFLSEASSEVARETCVKQYTEAIDRQVHNKKTPLKLEELVPEHEAQKQKAINDYRERNSFGRKNEAAFEKNLQLLKDAIEQQYQGKYFPRVSTQTAHEAAKKQYKTAMEAFLERRAELTLDNLKAEHDKEQIRALALYQDRNGTAIKNTEIFDEHLQLLLQEIDEICNVQYMPRVSGEAALEACLKKYSAAIENLIMNRESTVKLQILEDKREEEKQKAIGYFQEENESGRQNAALFKEYQALLEQKIEELFEAKFLSEANSEVARETCVKQYTEAIDRQVHNTKTPLKLEELVLEHEAQKQKAINDYRERNSFGRKNEAAFEKNLQLLKDAIEQQYQVEYIPRVSSQTAHEASKKQYKTAMDTFLQREAELTLSDLKAVHDKEKKRAVSEYQQGSVSIRNKEIFKNHSQLLQQEIDHLYGTKYLPRVGSQVTLAACKSQYERAMDSLIEDRASMLTFNELADFHEEEVQKAITKYQDENKFCQNEPSSASQCETRLRQELGELHDEKYAPLVSSRAALASCLKQYKEALSDCHGDREKLSLQYLMNKHAEQKAKAIADYREGNNLGRKNPTIRQEYKKRLLKEIDDMCDEEIKLRTNSQAALDDGLKLYVNAVKAFFDNNENPSSASLKKQIQIVTPRAIAAYQMKNESTRRNLPVFEGYQELMEEDIYKYFEKDAQVAHLMDELDTEKQRYKLCRMM